MPTSIAKTAQNSANLIDAMTAHLRGPASIARIIDNAFEAALEQCQVLCLPGEEMEQRDYEKACQQTLSNLANLGVVAEQAILEFALKMFEEHPDYWHNLGEWHAWIDIALQATPVSDTMRSTIYHAVPKVLFRLKQKPVIRELPNGQTVGVDHTTFLQPGKATFVREIMGHVTNLGDSEEDQRIFENWVLLACTQKRSNLRALLSRPDVDVNQILMGYIDPSSLANQPPSRNGNGNGNGIGDGAA